MALANDKAYIDLFMGRFGRRSDAYLRSVLINELNVQKDVLELGSFLPWFLEADADIALVAGTTTYALPSNFLREVEQRENYVIDSSVSPSDYTVPKKREEEVLQRLHANSDDGTLTGRPTRYSIRGDGLLRVYPEPDKSYTFRLFYFATTAAVADSESQLNSWLQYAPNYLCGLACSVVAGFHLQNQGKAQMFSQLAAASRQELISHHEARLHTNMDYSDSDALVEGE